jgi:phage FluMu gp28-like protein
MRMAFEKRTLRVPVNRVIREDLHSVNRVTTPAGQINYRAPHNADGHADRCTALALALRAAGDGNVSPCIESWPRYGNSDWPWKNIRKPRSPGGHPLYPWML